MAAEAPLKTVSVLMPTFRRPHRAIDAARSVFRQRIPDRVSVELVLVDNDPDGSARHLATDLAKDASMPFRVVHEPRAGVANARNAALAASDGQFIAFLDDDEIAPEDWLSELLRVQAATGAHVVFGPVRTRLPADPGKHRDYYEAFFARQSDAPEGVIHVAYGCGCSLIMRAALPEPQPFSVERNEIGGEDDLLFQTMAQKGGIFAWAPGAWVWETPEPHRVSLDYTLRRAFAYGQGPATKAINASPPRLAEAMGWMCVGAAQTAIFGAASAVAHLTGSPRRAFTYRRLAEGLGKLLWFPVFKPRFYGAASTPATAAPPRTTKEADA